MGCVSWVIRTIVVASILSGGVMFFYWRKSTYDQTTIRPTAPTEAPTPPPLDAIEMRLKVTEDAKTFKNCMNWHFNRSKDITDEQFPEQYILGAKRCLNKSILKSVKPTPYNTSEGRILYVYKQNSEEELSVVIELGATDDLKMETSIHNRLGKDSEIIVADPGLPKDKLSEMKRIGTFLEHSVGATPIAQDSTAPVDKLYMDVITFIKQSTGRLRIDHLILNKVEYSYEILPLFLKGGKFDENGFVICQMNVMIDPNNYSSTTPVLKQLTEDNRYIPLRVFANDTDLRIFFVNAERPHCVDKYLSHYLE